MRALASGSGNSLPLNPEGTGVALVAMPFLRLALPSLGLGLLKATLRQQDIPCDDYPLYLEFVREAGLEDAQAIDNYADLFAGDYVFAGELGFADAPDEVAFTRQRVERGELPREQEIAVAELLQRVRGHAIPMFLDRIVASVPWERYALIGLSSTFQQQAASLALARRLKLKFPYIPIILGGANVWGKMGEAWLEYALDLDYVCVGEGDSALPELFRTLRAGHPAETVPGIAARRDGQVVVGSGQPGRVVMDSLPTPDHSTYFRLAPAVGVQPSAITFEASRGCWWGAKQHCVFCGLNNDAMTFRAKSPDRLYAEIKELSQRYPVTAFQAADNILDRRYFPTVLRRLDEDGSDLTFFFEVKSNMRLAEIRDLRRAGVTEIQPGIESLSSPLLRLMRKGVTGIQNVFLLKWAQYFGMAVYWNVLSGFFGEQAEHYAQQAAWMRRMFHLVPPLCRVPILLERFSPLFEQPERYGISNVRARAVYRNLYPDPGIVPERIAYFFDHEATGRLPAAAFQEIDQVVSAWRFARENEKPALFYQRSPAGLLRIYDTRRKGERTEYTLTAPDDELYVLAGETVVSPDSLAAKLQSRTGLHSTPQRVRSLLDDLVAAGLAICEEDRYLSLALPASRRYWDRPFPGEDLPEPSRASLPVLSLATKDHQ